MSSGPTDFFQRQDDARRKTGRLLLLFGLAIIGLSFGTYIALLLAFGVSDISIGLADPLLFGAAFLVTTTFILFGSATKTSALKSGGSAVAEALGGVEVNGAHSDPLIRRYANVVEEMALASGVPVPRIYVLEYEQGINAFAAGYEMNDAAIAVTRGCLEQLTREELQGVVAHEFSHILNGDMRLNIRLIGVIHGILLMYIIGRGMLRVRSRGKNGGQVQLIGLALVIFGGAGLFFGRLIKSAVSREREYLADAAAVQFTRNPAGLAGALKKIAGYSHGSAIQSANAEEVSHMCFSSVTKGMSGMMATHPSIEERIRRLDPSFTGEKLFRADDRRQRLMGMAEGGDYSAAQVATGGAVSQLAGGRQGGFSQGSQAVMGLNSSMGDGGTALATPPRTTTDSGPLGASFAGGNDWSAQGSQQSYSMAPEVVVGLVGEASVQNLIYSSSLLQEVPRPIMEARTNLLGAMATVYVLLLDESLEQRKTQGQILDEGVDPALVMEVRRLWPSISRMGPELRLPVLDLVFPTLRQMTWQQYQSFITTVERLIMADGHVVLKEFIIRKVLVRRLQMAMNPPRGRGQTINSFTPLMQDLSYLLSCLAHSGHENINQAAMAFETGRERLPASYRSSIRFLGEGEWTFVDVDRALDRLANASYPIKRVVIDACAHCVLADGQVTVEETELLRTVGDSLDLPLPPFIPETQRRAS